MSQVLGVFLFICIFFFYHSTNIYDGWACFYVSVEFVKLFTIPSLIWSISPWTCTKKDCFPLIFLLHYHSHKEQSKVVVIILINRVYFSFSPILCRIFIIIIKMSNMYKIIYPITTQYKMCSPLIPEIYVHRHTNHTTCCFKVLVIIRSK